MIRTVTTLAFFTAIALPASARDLTGLWATGTEGGRVQIYRCGTALCGKVVDAARLRTNPDLTDQRNSDPKLRNRRLRGLVVLEGFTGGPAEWQGGPVYDPETGSGARKGYLKLLPDGKLELKGCVAFFCRTKIWTRAR
ncbi:DUF2147 domain-containing protein [Sphingomonas koreensis]|jgi:uncharacterized protein (DUF2147 family)|uniref:DUF2147 domain-containing protein n=1 Tax=Sphingomonas koreensis TaxID=93064 RepID=A0A1L6JEG1_9SPHN|nr:DUF2147 domain-containing protein [Sphingomonas koreensis]APR54197.1 hypothetical protein BRX40_18855 [Sphingomonas koreensis]MDC7809194.1 DUF2147 domain-containing protein [Sphingomonas koreensis]RSU17281.1 DUF2147 domain-containing protein [Sphingomonas koreensis]RSU21768.1 DUF2147 domain-containing protein [Sphingomonas koreensis]RSU25612.1 DUF2147 domain-containing protein [Sphingomonas koreensis]